MLTLATHPCTQAACTVGIDGKCLEGLSLEECPHYLAFDSPAPSSIAEDVAARSQSDEETDYVAFHIGDYLTVNSAREITRASLTRVILLLGEPDSGKSTLLASLNDAFQVGPFAEYAFARSLTLPGFERLCHRARIQSGRTRADTERTKPTEEIRFLHLGVRDMEGLRAKQDLLLADISGERLQLVKNSTVEAKKLDILARADHIALLIDGEKLVDPVQRHRAKNDALMLLRSCLDAEILGARTYVDVLFSKWDVVEAELARAEQTKAFVTQIQQEVEVRFKPQVSRLRFFNLAARPNPSSQLKPGFGLDQIFRSWVCESPSLVAPQKYTHVLGSDAREFARYAQ